MLVHNLFSPRNEVTDGGGGTGSLITFTGTPAGGGNADPPAADPPQGDPPADPPDKTPVHPSDDLVDYRDKDGLILGKYKTLDDFANGYKELSQKVREKHPEAPEKYDFSEFLKSDERLQGIESIPEDDPLWSKMSPLFKKHRISQEGANEILKQWFEYNLTSAPSEKSIKEAMGPNADETLSFVNTTAAKVFKPEHAEGLDYIGRNGKAIEVLGFLMKKGEGRQLPTELVGSASKTSQQLYDEAFMYKKSVKGFDSDPVAKRKYESMMQAAVEKEEAEETGLRR